jgi:hypothetical protein
MFHSLEMVVVLNVARLVKAVLCVAKRSWVIPIKFRFNNG